MPRTRTHRRAPCLCATLIVSILLASSAVAQNSLNSTSKAGGPYRFEVTTIKPGGTLTGTDIDPGGIVRLHSLSLKAMIAEAFNVQLWQIEGTEPWIREDEYDVVGKPPDDFARTMPDTRHTLYTINNPRLREMLQNLLEERFALKVHRTTKPGTVYLLERTGETMALHPIKTVSKDQPANRNRLGEINFAGNSWGFYDATMPELAQFASAYVLHRPVLDRTGLAGAFNYQSEPEDWDTYWADRTGSFLRMLKMAGFKLESGKGDVETLVIDHAEQPTSN